MAAANRPDYWKLAADAYFEQPSEVKNQANEIEKIIELGDLEQIKLIINRNNSNARVAFLCDTILIIVAKYSPSNDHAIAEVLLEHEADVNQRNSEGKSALHYAAQYVNYALVSILIQYKADVNAQDQQGHTPLIYATFYAESNGPSSIADIVELLLKHEADVNQRGPDGKTFLHYAVQQANYKLASLLIQHKADVNAQDQEGKTPLVYAKFYAERNGFSSIADIVELLLKHEADVNHRGPDSNTFLHYAAQQANYEFASNLIQHNADVNAQDQDGHSPLIYAAFKGNDNPPASIAAVIELLIEKGANVTQRSYKGFSSSLNYFAQHSNYDFVRILIQLGADVNPEDKNAITPLIYAIFFAKNNPIESIATTAELLIQNGANVNQRSPDGLSALHYFAQHANYALVSILIEHEANINAQDQDGHTPLIYAVFKGNDNSPESIAAVAKLLLKCGANDDQRYEGGKSVLHYFAQHANYALVRILIHHKSDVNAKDQDGKTPLIYAILSFKNNSPESTTAVVELLLEHEANVNERDAEGKSALHYAAQYANNTIVSILIQNKADVNAQDRQGHTPLIYATFLSDDNPPESTAAVVRLLLESGAHVNRPYAKSKSVLHYAAQHANDALLRVLIQLKAHVNAQDEDDKTPLIYATYFGGDNPPDSIAAIADLLLQAGTNPETTDDDGKSALDYAKQHNLTDTVALVKSAIDRGDWKELLEQYMKPEKHEYDKKHNEPTFTELKKPLIQQQPEEDDDDNHNNEPRDVIQWKNVKIHQLQDELQRMRLQLHQKDKQKRREQLKVKELKQELKTKEAEKKRAETKVKQIEDELEKLRHENNQSLMEGLQQQQQQFEEKLEELQKQKQKVEELQNQIKKIISEKQIAQSKIEHLQQEMDQKKLDLEKKQEELEREKQQVNQLQNEIVESSKFCYDLTKPPGICMIINIREYDGNGFDDREGSEYDLERVKKVFDGLGFVTLCRENLTACGIFNSLYEMKKESHHKYGAFVCFLMAHGTNGAIYGSDGEYQKLKDLACLFEPKNCATLRGKPKVFFVQACRIPNAEPTANSESGQQIASANSVDAHDFLFCYATTEDAVAFRDTSKGSSFIQTLCDVIEQESHRMQLTDMLAEVNNRLMNDPAITGADNLNRCQVMEVSTSLTHRFKLTNRRR